MNPPDVEPTGDVLERIATSVSTRIDRSRRRARAALGIVGGAAALLTIAGVGLALQPQSSTLTCYSGADAASVAFDGTLQPGHGDAASRALTQCTAGIATASDARTESSGSAADSSASTLAQPVPEYLVCRHDAAYGVLTLDPGARIDPVAACAAIGMQPAN